MHPMAIGIWQSLYRSKFAIGVQLKSKAVSETLLLLNAKLGIVRLNWFAAARGWAHLAGRFHTNLTQGGAAVTVVIIRDR